MTIKFEYKGNFNRGIRFYSESLLKERWNQIKEIAIKIQRESRQNHKFKTKSGNSERSIDVDINDTIKIAKVGFDQRVSNYVKYQHDGTKGPYPIVPKNKKALRFISNGKFAFSKKVIHPGLRADRFIHKAFNRLRKNLRLGFDISVKAVRRRVR